MDLPGMPIGTAVSIDGHVISQTEVIENTIG